MDTMSYSSFRHNLAATLDKVNDDHEPVMVTRQNGRPAIVMSVEDYNSFEATAYLAANPKNAVRLNQAIAEIQSGNVVQHDLIDK